MSDDVKRFESDDATVSWDTRVCIGIGECGRASGDLFVGGRKPWCDPSRADAAEIEDVIERCPSGALAVTFADKGAIETPTAENTITVVYNGPLYLRGQLKIEGAPENSAGLAFRAALCRCGQSTNMPFCNNNHEKTGFRDYGAVGETQDKATASGGPLEVAVAENGPLKVRGNVTIVAASGRRDWTGTNAVLCRCGMSSNKPFCDGSHRKEDWKEPGRIDA